MIISTSIDSNGIPCHTYDEPTLKNVIEKHRVVYVLRNRYNDKVYVGQKTYIRPKEFENYYGSGVKINYAIKKYGKESFIKTILEVCLTKKELDKAEIKWIKFYDAQNPDKGYNIAGGGSGVGVGETHPNFGKPRSEEYKAKMRGRRFTEEHKRKISMALKGKPVSENTRKAAIASSKNRKKTPEETIKRKASLKKWRDSLTPEEKQKLADKHKGKKYSEETKRKMSLRQIGKVLSKETRKKISESRKFVVYSEETRRKISQNNRAGDLEVRKKNSESNKGKIPWNKGKKASEETRRKLSEIRKDKPRSEEFKRKISEANYRSWNKIKSQKLIEGMLSQCLSLAG